MRTFESDFAEEKNKPSNKPIFLYTVYDYNGSSDDLNYAGYDTDVEFNSKTYSKFPITHEGVGENSEGQIDTVKVRVANVNRVIQGYLETYDLRGKKVEIITVFADRLDDASERTVETFYIDSYTANESVVEFTLTSQFDVQDIELPTRKFMRNYCQWKFKGTECAYAGAESSCDKTKATCKDTMDNYSRFGAFPSIPQHRIGVA